MSISISISPEQINAVTDAVSKLIQVKPRITTPACLTASEKTGVIYAGRSDFVASYMGQTASKTKQFLSENIGKVIIFDPACLNLGADDMYGKEALLEIRQFICGQPTAIDFVCGHPMTRADLGFPLPRVTECELTSDERVAVTGNCGKLTGTTYKLTSKLKEMEETNTVTCERPTRLATPPKERCTVPKSVPAPDKSTASRPTEILNKMLSTVADTCNLPKDVTADLAVEAKNRFGGAMEALENGDVVKYGDSLVRGTMGFVKEMEQPENKAKVGTFFDSLQDVLKSNDPQPLQSIIKMFTETLAPKPEPKQPLDRETSDLLKEFETD